MHAVYTLIMKVGHMSWMDGWVHAHILHTEDESRSLHGWVDGSMHAVYTLVVKVGHSLWVGGLICACTVHTVEEHR